MSSLATQFKELNSLDFNNLGDWPALAKLLSCLIVAAIVCGLGMYLFVFDQQDALEQAKQKELTLRDEFEKKQAKAANLEDYKKQMAVMQESFGALLRQLPKSTEVPGLVDDITYAGTASGLSFNQIRLEKEKRAEFYTEQPISIDVVGTYHQLGEFVSKVSGLPRIVTLHDFSITSKAGSDKLQMKVLAKTYRYDAEEGK